MNVIRFQPYGRTEQTAAAVEAAKDSEETLPNVLIYTKDNQHTPTKIEVRDISSFLSIQKLKFVVCFYVMLVLRVK